MEQSVSRILTNKGEMILFESLLTTFESSFLAKIYSSLKQTNVSKFNHVKLVQICWPEFFNEFVLVWLPLQSWYFSQVFILSI